VPLLPLGGHIPASYSADYYRHGTTTLFAALDMLTGNVKGEYKAKHESGLSCISFRRNRLGSTWWMVYGDHQQADTEGELGVRAQLTAAIKVYIEGRNKSGRAFHRTKSAATIMASIRRRREVCNG